MDVAEFRKLVISFADRPNDVMLEKGRLVAMIHGVEMDARVNQRADGLYVEENGVALSAATWVARRLAHLDELARRILEFFPEPIAFVQPRGRALDATAELPSINPTECTDASAVAINILDRRPAGAYSVLYLTSDAGEGKTTLITSMARQQAAAYLSKQTDWLMIPIALGGRPFLRFDEVTTAALVNTLRFHRLYFESFAALVHLGMLVPALDGFEELFVETTEGEAASALGMLLKQFRGQGTVLVATRRAYFDFHSLHAQARLLDSLPDVEVAFGELQLLRWDKQQFTHYAKQRGLANADAFFDSAAMRVGIDHPLLTRAVLVRRLVELALTSSSTEGLLDELRPQTDDFFGRFVDTIIQREVVEKWIDKTGDPPQPLLSRDEHHLLLSWIAEEMWRSKTAYLSGEMLVEIAGIVAEQLHKGPSVVRQLRARVPQHALLVPANSGNSQYSFDHDHFRDYFLAEAIWTSIDARRYSDVCRTLRVDVLPSWTFPVIAQELAKRDSCEALLDDLDKLLTGEPSASALRENLGGIAIEVMRVIRPTKGVFTGLIIPQNALIGMQLSDVTFEQCQFQSTSLHNAELSRVVFRDCVIERIELDHTDSLTACLMQGETVVHTVDIAGGTDSENTTLYAPESIDQALGRRGLRREGAVATSAPIATTDREANLAVVEKVVRTFHRTTRVNDGTLRLRLSVNFHRFQTELLPDLLEQGILKEVPHRGSGQQTWYQLGVPMGRLADAFARANGRYSAFLELARSG